MNFGGRGGVLRGVLTTLRRAEYAELIGLFALQGAALGMWIVPLSAVLEAHGLGGIRTYAFATSGLAAFVSPLLFGAVADRHASPVAVLRWLAVATAAAMALASAAIGNGASAWVVLGLIQVHAFCSAPAWSLGSTIVLARLRDSKKEFGSIRAMATIGWIAGCVLVSVCGADGSTWAGYGGAMMWLTVSAATWWLPAVEAPKAAVGLTWVERLGFDALALLRERDTRVVYLTVALFTIPLAAFYPYTPLHMRAHGLEHTSAWMSLGQVTEVGAMLALGALLHRWRLKWLMLAGLTLGVVRFALCACDTRWTLIAGVVLHGGSFTFIFITAQIYLDQRVDSAWRARAQALMTVLNSGVGNMVGYFGTGAWFAACQTEGQPRWTLFWGGLSGAMAVVLVFFVVSYRGRGVAPERAGAG